MISFTVKIKRPRNLFKLNSNAIATIDIAKNCLMLFLMRSFTLENGRNNICIENRSDKMFYCRF